MGLSWRPRGLSWVFWCALGGGRGCPEVFSGALEGSSGPSGNRCWASVMDVGGHLELSEAFLDPSSAILGALTFLQTISPDRAYRDRTNPTRRTSTGRTATGRIATKREATCRAATGRVQTGRVAIGRIAIGRTSPGRNATGRIATRRAATCGIAFSFPRSLPFLLLFLPHSPSPPLVD